MIGLISDKYQITQTQYNLRELYMYAETCTVFDLKESYFTTYYYIENHAKTEDWSIVLKLLHENTKQKTYPLNIFFK